MFFKLFLYFFHFITYKFFNYYLILSSFPLFKFITNQFIIIFLILSINFYYLFELHFKIE